MGIFGKLVVWFFMFLFGGIFFAVGAGIGYWSWLSSTWPTAPGVVTASQSEESTSSDSDGSSTTYKASIKYRFKVDSTEYNGNTYSYDDYGSSSSSHADYIVAQYPVGKEILVHYDPKSPTSCVITGGGFGLFPIIFGGIGLLVMTIPVLWIIRDICFLIFVLMFARKMTPTAPGTPVNTSLPTRVKNP